jgi:hypothetical protein
VHAKGSLVSIDAIRISKVDAAAPASITDLAAVTGSSEGSVDLGWTAPGDDGSTGTATSYEVRYSSTPITDQASWDGATAVTAGVPTPTSAGTVQSMTVTGLNPGITYYFAIRATDEAANTSGFSNSPSAPAKML